MVGVEPKARALGASQRLLCPRSSRRARAFPPRDL